METGFIYCGCMYTQTYHCQIHKKIWTWIYVTVFLSFQACIISVYCISFAYLSSWVCISW
ncbi:hypothetical protein BGX38DRAFT_1183654 [Terfezia claveryi]|nr:hypothetical protein BGX38DRAFT_1183654 [Terfezia claveryi]